MLEGLPEGHQRVLWGQLPGKRVVRGELRLSSRAPPPPRADLPAGPGSSSSSSAGNTVGRGSASSAVKLLLPLRFSGWEWEAGVVSVDVYKWGVQSSAYGDLGLGVDAKFPLVIPRVQAEASEREERIKRQQFRRATSLLCTEDDQTLSETVTRVKSPSMLADPQLVTTTANLTLSTSEEPRSGSDSTTNQLCGPAGYICFSHSPLFPHISLERAYFFFFKGLSTRERGGFAFPWF